ncbi:phosphoglycerate mutase [Sphingomonas sp. BHC-A]|uniref:Phosphoglycerate mutase n=1 Tax=Sphingobium indicum (strain DSM 16412 / CCM 7286 / MTCC 6364 / B90A) TaxID=861109 RepID=A0A1L5BQG8_SPHIB|nr:histidine phosphatase family protein [Sphingobium indicum]APL95119.1 phosphoglycerate mutase [Sphingobium indicum B90A]KEZ00093.1 phosphoglycerate mutase [Sphingomonas sp. BHC-A]
MNAFPLHLMRHGAPQLAGRLLGHLDAPPEAEGIALCVDRARHLDFARVVTSDLARARTPGAAIAAERDVELDVDSRWRELHFGDWEGADPARLPAEDLARFWDDPDGFPPPGGESWTDLCNRIGDGLAALGEPVLVVCHAGAIRAALSVLCGFDARRGWAVDLPYGAVLSLRIWPEGPSGQITGLIA